MPENPWFVWVAAFKPGFEHFMQLLGHRDFSWGKMTAFLFPGIKNDEPSFQINVFPQKLVNFAHPGHSFPDCPKIILGIWICDSNYLVYVLIGWDIFYFLFNREKVEPFSGVFSNDFFANAKVESSSQIPKILISSES